MKAITEQNGQKKVGKVGEKKPSLFDNKTHLKKLAIFFFIELVHTKC